MVGNWLYGVAHQTALKAGRLAAKRRARERQVADMPEPEAGADNDLWGDLQPLLDQELSRLPDKYRVAIVLCDLEGKTRKEAARQLGLPEGTLAESAGEGEGDAGEAARPARPGRVGRGVGGGAVAAGGVGGRAGLGGGFHDQGRKPVCGGASGGYGGDLRPRSPP